MKDVVVDRGLVSGRLVGMEREQGIVGTDGCMAGSQLAGFALAALD